MRIKAKGLKEVKNCLLEFFLEVVRAQSPVFHLRATFIHSPTFDPHIYPTYVKHSILEHNLKVTQHSMLISRVRDSACRWRRRWRQLKMPSPTGLPAAPSSGHRSSTSWPTWWKPTWRSLPKPSPETKVSHNVFNTYCVSTLHSFITSSLESLSDYQSGELCPNPCSWCHVESKIQVKLWHLLGLWTFPDRRTTSASSRRRCSTTPPSAARWTTLAASTTPSAVQWEWVRAQCVLHHNLWIIYLGLMCFSIVLCVAGLISPWNLPLYLLTWKIAPAIAAGNTVVAKPSEMTSVTAWMLCKLMQEAGRTAAPTMQQQLIHTYYRDSLIHYSICT